MGDERRAVLAIEVMDGFDRGTEDARHLVAWHGTPRAQEEDPRPGRLDDGPVRVFEAGVARQPDPVACCDQRDPVGIRRIAGEVVVVALDGFTQRAKRVGDDPTSDRPIDEERPPPMLYAATRPQRIASSISASEQP